MDIQKLFDAAQNKINRLGVMEAAYTTGISIGTAYTIKRGGKVKIETLLKVIGDEK